MATPVSSTAQLPADDTLHPVFLFAYANDRADGGRFLRNLPEERRRIKQALQGAEDQGRCRIVECAGATLDEVLNECQRYARSLVLLHFAGHADSGSLLFETTDGHAHTVSAGSLTEFLGCIKRLHLVFLNGCCTRAQVDALLAHGVRAVVATTSAVPDEIAMELAERFYRAIEGGATIEDAFHQATSAVRATLGESAHWRERPAGQGHFARDVDTDESTSAPFPWGLFGQPDALARQLMAARSTDRGRCLVVITATLEQFDAAMIARVTAELQRVAGDLTLQIRKIEEGSVRLHLELTEEGVRRLVTSWTSGKMIALCGFAVTSIKVLSNEGHLAVVRQAAAGTLTEMGPDLGDKFKRPEDDRVLDDYVLLEAWSEGDRAAGNKLFERHYASVERFFDNKVSDPAQNDLIIETFLACLKSASRSRNQARFKIFLFATAHDVLVDYVRRLSRRMAHLGPETDIDEISAESLGLSPVATVVQNQEHHILREALRRIPLIHQVTLELYYWMELTAVEISYVLDVPVGTVRARLRDGRVYLEQQLRKLLSSPEALRSTTDDLDGWPRRVRAPMAPEDEDKTSPRRVGHEEPKDESKEDPKVKPKEEPKFKFSASRRGRRGRRGHRR